MIRWTHYTKKAGVHVEHWIAIKAFGRYLVVMWHWS